MLNENQVRKIYEAPNLHEKLIVKRKSRTVFTQEFKEMVLRDFEQTRSQTKTGNKFGLKPSIVHNFKRQRDEYKKATCYSG